VGNVKDYLCYAIHEQARKALSHLTGLTGWKNDLLYALVLDIAALQNENIDPSLSGIEGLSLPSMSNAWSGAIDKDISDVRWFLENCIHTKINELLQGLTGIDMLRDSVLGMVGDVFEFPLFLAQTANDAVFTLLDELIGSVISPTVKTALDAIQKFENVLSSLGIPKFFSILTSALNCLQMFCGNASYVSTSFILLSGGMQSTTMGDLTYFPIGTAADHMMTRTTDLVNEIIQTPSMTVSTIITKFNPLHLALNNKLDDATRGLGVSLQQAGTEFQRRRLFGPSKYKQQMTDIKENSGMSFPDVASQRLQDGADMVIDVVDDSLTTLDGHFDDLITLANNEGLPSVVEDNLNSMKTFVGNFPTMRGYDDFTRNVNDLVDMVDESLTQGTIDSRIDNELFQLADESETVIEDVMDIMKCKLDGEIDFDAICDSGYITTTVRDKAKQITDEVKDRLEVTEPSAPIIWA
jgi:hypothetical protein